MGRRTITLSYTILSTLTSLSMRYLLLVMQHPFLSHQPAILLISSYCKACFARMQYGAQVMQGDYSNYVAQSGAEAPYMHYHLNTQQQVRTFLAYVCDCCLRQCVKVVSEALERTVVNRATTLHSQGMRVRSILLCPSRHLQDQRPCPPTIPTHSAQVQHKC